jgi:hypothetical protein
MLNSSTGQFFTDASQPGALRVQPKYRLQHRLWQWLRLQVQHCSSCTEYTSHITTVCHAQLQQFSVTVNPGLQLPALTDFEQPVANMWSSQPVAHSLMKLKQAAELKPKPCISMIRPSLTTMQTGRTCSNVRVHLNMHVTPTPNRAAALNASVASATAAAGNLQCHDPLH